MKRRIASMQGYNFSVYTMSIYSTLVLLLSFRTGLKTKLLLLEGAR
jgi:hypothetical protein